MISSKLLRKKTKEDLGCVVVSWEPNSIMLRHSGKEFYNTSEYLIKIRDGVVIFDMSIAEKYGLEVKIL